MAVAGNKTKFINNYNVMSQIGVQTNRISVASDITIDYANSLAKKSLFSDSYKTFEVPFGPDYAFSNVFKGMCTSGFNVSPHSNYHNFLQL